ncbi:MAG: DUF1629 domain-containing protein [Pseudomonadota bacterium]
MAYMWRTGVHQALSNLVKKNESGELIDGAGSDIRFAEGIWERHHAMDDPGSPIAGGGVFRSGYPAKPETVPTMAQFIKNPKKIPDIFGSAGVKLVSDSVKHTIESLEPNIHRFYPIDLYWVNGESAERRWALNICQRIDGVDKEKSSLWESRYPVDKPRVGGKLSALMLDHKHKRLVLSASQISGHHLWYDKYYSGMAAFLSDDLMAAFKAAKVTGARFTKVDVQ